MIKDPPRAAPPLTRVLPTVTASLRPARRADAARLADLSRPFVGSGLLRERPVSLYAAHASDFLVLEGTDGSLEGYVGLRVHPATAEDGRGPAGVVYNFCVSSHRQGRGAGSRLLQAVLAQARNESLVALFTATTGGGGLFLRHGFAPASTALAPPLWVESLDPRRDARILARVP